MYLQFEQLFLPSTETESSLGTHNNIFFTFVHKPCIGDSMNYQQNVTIVQEAHVHH